MEPVGGHPLVEGLFAVLPEDGAVWDFDARAKWFAAAEAIFDLIYRRPAAAAPDDSDDAEHDDEVPEERVPRPPRPEADAAFGDTPTRRVILQAMRQGSRRLKDIVAKTGLSYQSVASSLQNMSKNGYVVRVDQGLYEVTPSAPSSGAH